MMCCPFASIGRLKEQSQLQRITEILDRREAARRERAAKERRERRETKRDRRQSE